MVFRGNFSANTNVNSNANANANRFLCPTIGVCRGGKRVAVQLRLNGPQLVIFRSSISPDLRCSRFQLHAALTPPSCTRVSENPLAKRHEKKLIKKPYHFHATTYARSFNFAQHFSQTRTADRKVYRPRAIKQRREKLKPSLASFPS